MREISSSSAEVQVSPPWTQLPSDLTANILQRLGSVEILKSARKVCATWWKVCQDPAMWRVIKIISAEDNQWECTTMCRCAVDRSQGQLIDLTIAYFGDGELLQYIVDRSSRLRRLTVACCYNISGTALTDSVKKLAELEELRLFIPSILAADIETIGISCPKLKSFTFNQCQLEHLLSEFEPVGTISSNEDALAIAKSMPNLCCLRLCANKLDNEGLLAILDGCPHLKSLDLRQCFGVDIGGPLANRCWEQIKDLRVPSVSMQYFGLDLGEFYDDGFD
ncbi:hypothetical protein C2S52_003624 [Perilla frutescens var. hirtella]|nr:hypothetical protein C2S52_003624 [Perilla frutescens var. hirtella]